MVYKNETDRHFTRNLLSVSAVEAFWGIGIPVVMESTFLQLFLNSLGAPKTIIGSSTGILYTGSAIFGLLSAYLTTHLKFKRRAVIIAHIVTSIPLGIFGLILMILGKSDYTLIIFLAFYFIFSLGLGITSPVWQNFIVKIFSSEKSIKAVSIMMISQIISRLIGGLFILKMVSYFAFSTTGSALIFVFISLLFLSGTFFFFFVKEYDTNTDEDCIEAHSIKSLFLVTGNILKNRNYMLYLASCLELYVFITTVSFYADYAVEFHSIGKATAAGLFIVAIQTGAVISGIIFGWLNFLNLKNKFIISKLFLSLSLVMLIFAQSLSFFLLLSFFLGLSRGIQNSGSMTMIKKLSGLSDATDYFAITPLLLLPVAIGLPFLSGLFLDIFHSSGILSYKILFTLLIIMVLLSLTGIVQIRMEKNTR